MAVLRKYFGEMLDELREDRREGRGIRHYIRQAGPDRGTRSGAVGQTGAGQIRRGGRRMRKLEAQVAELAKEFDSDAQFAAALRRFGPVVLGNFFLEPQEVRGIDGAVLDKYAEMVQWYALNRVPLQPATGKADFAALLNNYQFEGTLYSATIANISEPGASAKRRKNRDRLLQHLLGCGWSAAALAAGAAFRPVEQSGRYRLVRFARSADACVCIWD